MKAVMMSIQPKWVEKILNGDKTIEVRKTAPKFERQCSKLADECGEMYREPFKVYIYMTQGKLKDLGSYSDWIYENRQKVVAEFTCDRIFDIVPCRDFDTGYCVSYEFRDCQYGTANHCLSFKELDTYLKGNYGYAWHISDLKIYDKPRELGEFHKIGQYGEPIDTGMKRPIESWGYVEEQGDV